MSLRTTIQSGTSSCIPWVDSGVKTAAPWVATANYIEMFPDTQYQTIVGFGGTFQEVWWEAMKVLSPAGQDSIIRAFWDTSGCNWNFGRIPIGCCDYDLQQAPYSLDDNAGDYQMTNFSLHRDSLRRIPLIKMAQAYKPNIRFFGSPWSPPGWMKSNNSYTGGNMKSDSTTLTAYALYLSKFVQEYKKAGINVDAVCCQNEPDQSKSYPSGLWSKELEKTFYHSYMIPQFKKDNLDARIILGVFCCGNYSDWCSFFMEDSLIHSFTRWTSHSFETSGQTWGPLSYAQYPEAPFIETESSYKAGKSADWGTGVNQWSDRAIYMSTTRCSAWTDWDCVNDETSNSGGSWAPTLQPVMVNINKTTKQVVYNPYYWVAKHFSHDVQIGARAIQWHTVGITNLVSAAFRNPNGDLIFVTNNKNSTATPITIKVGDQMFNAVMPANSFNTFVMPKFVAAQEVPQLNATRMATINDARIRNSTLYFTIPASLSAPEMLLTLTDLQGRRIWTEHRSGMGTQGKQTIAIRSGQGGLRSGTYLLTIKIKNGASDVRTLEQKVTTVF